MDLSKYTDADLANVALLAEPGMFDDETLKTIQAGADRHGKAEAKAAVERRERLVAEIVEAVSKGNNGNGNSDVKERD